MSRPRPPRSPMCQSPIPTSPAAPSAGTAPATPWPDEGPDDATRAAIRDDFIRKVVTALGMPQACDLAACRRAKACAGRHLPCYAAHRHEIRPIIRSILDHGIMADLAAGKRSGLAPEAIERARRRVAEENEAAARIAAGGPVDEDCAYDLWLRAVVVPRLGQRGALAGGAAPHLGDGRPPDPGAKLRE